MAATDPDSTRDRANGAGRVGTLRINFVWGAVQPTAGAPYDWSHYDAIIGAAAQQGIRVLPTVYSSPPGWRRGRTTRRPDGFSGPFRAFVQAAAQRYGSNGTFWSSNPAIPKTPVTDWQLWNEMNSPSFWFHKPSAKQYVRSQGLQRRDQERRPEREGRARRAVPDAPDPERDPPRPLPARRSTRPRASSSSMRSRCTRTRTTPKDALRAVTQTPQDHGPVQGHEGQALDHRDRLGHRWQPTPLTVSPQRQAAYLTTAATGCSPQTESASRSPA